MTNEPSWWLLLNEDGSTAEQVQCVGNPVMGPNKQCNWPVDRVKEITREGDLATEEWHVNGWQPNAEKVQAQLLAGIDIDRDEKLGEGVRDLIYMKKAMEARIYLLAGGGAWTSDKNLCFPWLAREVKRTGLEMKDVARNILQQALDGDKVLMDLEDKALAAKQAVRDASSAVQMREAASDPWGRQDKGTD